MKKVLALCLASLGVLTACSGLSPQDFVKKVEEKNATLVRTEYNTAELTGKVVIAGQEIPATANSVCTVTWVQGEPVFTPKFASDPFVNTVGSLVTHYVVLTNELANELTAAQEGLKCSFSQWGTVQEGSAQGGSARLECKWNDELLLVKFNMTASAQGVSMTYDVGCNWKVAN